MKSHMTETAKTLAKAGLTTSNHLLSGIEPVATVMEQLRYRSEHRDNHQVEKASHLQLRWHDQGPNHPESAYYARLDGKELPLNSTAMKTANRLIKIGDPKHWNQYPDRDAFPKAFNHIMDAKDNGRLLVRSDGLTVNAILPAKYKIRDAHELLGDFLDGCKENMGEIKGVGLIDQNNGDISKIRVIMGTNILPSFSSDAERQSHGQYMMFNLLTSETGLCDTETTLGTFRGICSNSAIRVNNLAKWNHNGSAEKFYDKTHETIRMSGYFQGSYVKIFEALLGMKLEAAPSDILTAFHQEDLITAGHYDAASLHVDAATEDGRPVETQYDLFNVLTRGAQDMDSIRARERAEADAMTLFTSPGGIYRQLEEAALERSRRGE